MRTREPHFDLDEVQRLVHLIGTHNAAWREWFDSAGIEPHPVRYTELAADPAGAARDVLSFPGLELPVGRELRAQHERLAGELSTQWIQHYRAEAG